jgi:hypothetical protein
VVVAVAPNHVGPLFVVPLDCLVIVADTAVASGQGTVAENIDAIAFSDASLCFNAQPA